MCASEGTKGASSEFPTLLRRHCPPRRALSIFCKANWLWLVLISEADVLCHFSVLRYDDGDLETHVPLSPTRMRFISEPDVVSDWAMLSLKDAIGATCSELHLLPCLSSLIMRHDPVSKLSQNETAVGGFSFFPFNVPESEPVQNRGTWRRNVCGNATGMFLSLPGNANTSSHGSHTAGPESLFHKRLRDDFKLMGSFAVGYLQLAHLPPPYMQPCAVGDRVTAIWATYSVPLPATITAVNRGNVKIHSPVHRWEGTTGGILLPFTITVAWDDGDTTGRTVPAFAVFSEDGVSCSAREGLAPFTAYSMVKGISNDTSATQEEHVAVDIAQQCTLIYGVKHGSLFSANESSDRPHSPLQELNNSENASSMWASGITQTIRGALGTAVLSSGRLVKFPSRAAAIDHGLNPEAFGRVKLFKCPAAQRRLRSDALSSIAARASNLSVVLDAQSHARNESVDDLLSELSRFVFGMDTPNSQQSSLNMSGTVDALARERPMQQKFYWTHWFNVDRPEIVQQIGSAELRHADNETIANLRSDANKLRLPPIPEEILPATREARHRAYVAEFVPPCGGTLQNPISPVKVQCQRASLLLCALSSHAMNVCMKVECQIESITSDLNPWIQRNRVPHFGTVAQCDVANGLMCTPSDSGLPCNDFKARYLCPRPDDEQLHRLRKRWLSPAVHSVEEPIDFRSESAFFPYWTPWLNRDAGNSNREDESLASFQSLSGIDPCSSSAPWVANTLKKYDFLRSHSQKRADALLPTALATVGQKVEGKWKDRSQWYPGQVTKVSEAPDTSEIRVDILYEDGDTERWVPLERIRPHPETLPSVPHFEWVNSIDVSAATWMPLRQSLYDRVPLAAECTTEEGQSVNSSEQCGSSGLECRSRSPTGCTDHKVRFLCPPLASVHPSQKTVGVVGFDAVTQSSFARESMVDFNTTSPSAFGVIAGMVPTSWHGFRSMVTCK